MSAIAELTDMLRVGRERHRKAVPQVQFKFRQLAGDEREISPGEPFTLTYVISKTKFKRDMREAFANRYAKKNTPPAPERTADMAFCEEDNGFYIWNGDEWRVVGYRC